MENMMNMVSNNVVVRGTVVGEPEFSHKAYGKKIYKMFIGVERKSGVEDRVPVLVPEHLWDVNTDLRGEYVKVTGRYHTEKKKEDGKNRVLQFVFAKTICVEQKREFVKGENRFFLSGSVCKQPVYKKTPLGREICEVLLVVHRAYGKFDYIPCIFWGRNARDMANKQVGDQIRLEGRIQSRNYEKKYEDTVEIRTAYEISVARYEMVREAGLKLEL